MQLSQQREYSVQFMLVACFVHRFPGVIVVGDDMVGRKKVQKAKDPDRSRTRVCSKD